MAVWGPLNQQEIALGERFDSQTITLNGSPTSGTFYARFLGQVSDSWSMGASAATVEAALRTMTHPKMDFSNVTVTLDSTDVWTVDFTGLGWSVPVLLEVITDLVGDATAYASVTGTPKPQIWPTPGPLIGISQVEQTAAKTITPGPGSERSSQTQVAEWVQEDFSGGLGRRDLKEQETVARIYDSNAWSFIERQLTLGPLIQTPTFSTALTQFNNPLGLYVDGAGTYAYIADSNNYVIRKVTIADGTATTFAGDGTDGHADATGASAKFHSLIDMCSDGTNLYVIDGHCIRKIVIATAVVTTLCGSYNTAGNVDSATATDVRFSSPFGIATDGTYLYVADAGNSSIRKVTIANGATATLCASPLSPNRDITVFGGYVYWSATGAGNVIYRAAIASPTAALYYFASQPIYGLTNDGTDIYFMNGYALCKLDHSTVTRSVLAGNDAIAGTTDGDGTAARFNNAGAMQVYSGYVYLTDSGQTLRKAQLTSSYTVSTLAGTPGIAGYTNGTGVPGTERMVHAGHIKDDGNGDRTPYIVQQGSGTMRLTYWDTGNEYWKQRTTQSVSGATARDTAVFKDVVYAAFGTDANPGYAVWVPDTGGTEDYSYITSSITDTDSGSNAAIAAFAHWDGKLFRILTTGQIGYTSAPSTLANSSRKYAAAGDWTSPAGMKVYSPGQIISMKAYEMGGENVLYILTTEGLYYLDFGNAVTHRITGVTGLTNLDLAINGGNAMETWGGKLYFIANNSVYSYDGRTMTNIGPNTDQGLPTASYVFKTPLYCRSLHSSNYWLFVSMTNSDDTAGAVLGYNGRGWQPIVPYQEGLACRAALVTAVTSPRLYTVYGHYIDFNDAIGNPLFWSGQHYAESSTLIPPWFDRAMAEVPKTFYRVRIRGRQISDTETVTIYHQIDNAADSTSSNTGNDPRHQWTQLLDESGNPLTIDAATLGGSTGVLLGYFDRVQLPNGQYFSRGRVADNLRFRVDFARGSDSLLTPVIEMEVTQFDVKFDPFIGSTVELDLSRVCQDRVPERLYKDFLVLIRTRNLLPYAFQADDIYPVTIRTWNGAVPAGGWANMPPDVKPIFRVAVAERLLG